MLHNRRFITPDEDEFLNTYEPTEDGIRSYKWFLFMNVILIIVNIIRLIVGVFDIFSIRSECINYDSSNDFVCQIYGLNPDDEAQINAYVGEMVVYLSILAVVKIVINFIAISAYQLRSYKRINFLFAAYAFITAFLLLFQANPISILEYMIPLYAALRLRPLFMTWERTELEIKKYKINMAPKISDALLKSPYGYHSNYLNNANYGITTAIPTRAQSFGKLGTDSNHGSSNDLDRLAKKHHYIEMKSCV